MSAENDMPRGGTVGKDDKGICESCGGMVDEHGLAMGADVDEVPSEENETAPDNESNERMRASSFADAVRRRGSR